MDASLQTATPFTKSIRYDRITHDYRAELDGQLIGFYPSSHAAEVALDQAVYDRLVDGDCHTAAEMDAPIEDGEGVNWNSFDPPAPEPPVVITEAPDPTPPERAHPHAVTRQSIQIEATMRRCHNCGADHRTWQCPEIASKLFAPETPDERLWYDAELGRELCWMVWHRYGAFITLLRSVPVDQLVIYAASYQAFMRSYNPQSTLTISEILEKWSRWMRGDRGPAAPALRLVA